MQTAISFDLIVLFHMDSLNKTRSLFNIKVHEYITLNMKYDKNSLSLEMKLSEIDLLLP